MATPNRITEQFLTVQGEGRSVGRTAYFIRLAGCNLWCRWCDSLHSVDPQLFKGKTFPVDYSKIPDSCHLVVVTGGEPTLFNLAEIRDQVRRTNPQREIEIESNATRFPVDIVDAFLWNLSPKLSSSEQKSPELDQKRLGEIDRWAAYAIQKPDRVIFKFVVTSPQDFAEILEIVQQHQIPRHLVYLMAEGQLPETQSPPAINYILDFVKEQGFNFSPRLHIMYWGQARGV